LLSEHGRFVKGAFGFLSQSGPALVKLGLLDPFAIGQRVPYLNCIEILKLGRSVDFLLVNGYHSSAQHVCRAMINAYFNIKAIVWPTSDFLSPISGTWTRSKQLRLQTFMEASADSRLYCFCPNGRRYAGGGSKRESRSSVASVRLTRWRTFRKSRPNLRTKNTRRKVR
jgi:hypothetical protein